MKQEVYLICPKKRRSNKRKVKRFTIKAKDFTEHNNKLFNMSINDTLSYKKK